VPIRSWREVDENLAAATGPTTLGQLALAEKIGIVIDPTLPHVVAAALLRVALQKDLSIALVHSEVERFEERLDNLRREGDPEIKPTTGEEASAWIEYLHMVRRREALAAHQLREGDIVMTPNEELAVVSSISSDGRVYFKGGAGQCAWPDLLTVKARGSDASEQADVLRGQAANAAANKRQPSEFSLAKAQALMDWAVDERPTHAEIDEFERVIVQAEDERPIQQHLQKNPHLLTVLLAGKARYCVALPRLGSLYVPDFVIGAWDSMGLRWVAIELETPRSGIYLKGGRQFDEKAREALAQIRDWREWLMLNLADARRPHGQKGLGLIDIRPQVPAIVMIGRRGSLNTPDDLARHEAAEFKDIEVQTYDRLLERLRGAISFAEPLNRYLI
jgi:hypothetical protein